MIGESALAVIRLLYFDEGQWHTVHEQRDVRSERPIVLLAGQLGGEVKAVFSKWSGRQDCFHLRPLSYGGRVAIYVFSGRNVCS